MREKGQRTITGMMQNYDYTCKLIKSFKSLYQLGYAGRVENSSFEKNHVSNSLTLMNNPEGYPN